MPTTLKSAVQKYLRSRNPAPGTRAEYRTTLAKWKSWSGGAPIERLGRKEIREFLDWVYDRAIADEGTNPGRTANKAREQLRAVISWAWEQDLIDSLPRFPKPRPQRDVAGRHYLTKAEINGLSFATHELREPRGWSVPISVGRFWRAASLCSSITVLTRGPSGDGRHFMHRFSGATSPGPENRPTVR